MPGIDVVEPLAEAVYDNAWVRNLDPDVGVGAILVVERQVRLPDNERRLAIADAAAARADPVDLGAAEEPAAGLGDAHEHDGHREADDEVDAGLEVGENHDDDGGEEGERLKRRHLPEAVHDVGRRDEIADGVDDEARQTRRRDVEEHRRQHVERQ